MLSAKISLIFVLSLTILPLISCQLRAFVSNAKLPSSRSYISSFYDGDDQVYLFGGFRDSNTPPALADIAIFTISTDSLEVVGQLPVPTYQAKAVASPNGEDIILFTQFTEVYRFQKATRNVTLVASLPLLGNWWDGFIQISNTSVLFFTEASSSVNPGSSMVLEFNLETYETTQLAELPVPLTYVNGFWDRADSVYIFGETFPENRRNVMMKYSLMGKNYTTVLEEFVGMKYQTSVVWDGQNATLVAGYPRGVPDNGVTIYDPTSNTAVYSEVQDWPALWLNLHSTSAVYVDGLRRIYVFGGFAYGFRDDIWYIERPL